MNHRHLWSCVLILLFAMAFAGTVPASAEAIDLEQLRIPHEKFVLENGLTLLVHEDHSVPIVAVNLWYHVGSKDEKRGRTGFAHLFEHFFFNGSENYPFGFREAMDDLGANNRNGTTSVDRTNFFEDVPVSALERTLYLEADRLGFLAGNLSEEMLERERGVVKNEKRQGENRPYGRVFGRVVEALYPAAHPYSWSPIGTMEDLDAATLEDIREWYETYYNPNNVVLSLAGDVTAERALELVRKYFGSIPPGPPLTRYDQWIPRLEGNIRDVMEDRVPQSRVYRFYHAPPWGAPELIHLDLFASVLSGSRSARLDRALVYEKEIATSVTAWTWKKTLGSNFAVIVTAKPEVAAEDAEREMEMILDQLIEEGPTEEELQRARTRILASFARGMERLGGFGGRSDILAESMTFAGDPEAYLAHLEILATATPADVVAAGRKWLTQPHYTITVVPYPELAPAKEDLDRSILPALGEAPDVEFPRIQRARLDNGLEVILMERHSVPLVNVTLAVDAGYASDPSGSAGLASLATGLLDNGTKTREIFQIVDELDALGAQLWPGSNLDLSFLRLRALRMNFDQSLEIMADVALNPVFPEELVSLGKERRLAAIRQEKADPLSSALRILPTLIYPDDHAYSTPFTGSGLPETVGGLSRADLVAWHERWFRPASSTLIVAGAVTMEEILPAVQKYFGSWDARRAPEKNLADVNTTNRGRVFLVDKPGAPQSVIAAAHVTGAGGSPDDLALETVVRNFGGMATSRLNRNLRLDKHWSYGTFGFVQNARAQRPFLVVAPVQTDRTKESLLEVQKEILDLAGRRPVAGEEFDSIMRNMVLRLPGRYETLSSLEGAGVDLVNLRYPDSHFSDYAQNVRNLTPEDLDQAARRFVRPDELVWLIVGDLAKIEPGVRELGFGEVIRIDPEGRRLGGD